ncbi:MAG: transposase [Byssovorax sp.]
MSEEKQLGVLAGLVEGNSERAIERMTGVNRQTVNRFGLRYGLGAQRLHDRLVRNLNCSTMVLDEMWTWCLVKGPRAQPKHGPDAGEQWIWVALDQSSRCVVSFHVGRRDQESADIIALDMRARLNTMPQLIVSDGLLVYKDALLSAMGVGLTYATMMKNVSGGTRGPDHRYEPGRNMDFIKKSAVFGNPNLDRATTYAVERNNLTMRHHIGRTRRLCLAFSKKLENLRAAAALNYVHYNFCLISKALRVTPAMAAGVTDHVWDLPELLAVILAEPAGAKPVAGPMANAAPPPDATTKPLPPGRGFLSVIQGGRSSQRSGDEGPPPPAAPKVAGGGGGTATVIAAPAAPVQPATSHAPTTQVSPPVVPVVKAPSSPIEAGTALTGPPSPGATAAPFKQLDLFAWRPKGQLSLFGDEPPPRKT